MIEKNSSSWCTMIPILAANVSLLSLSLARLLLSSLLKKKWTLHVMISYFNYFSCYRWKFFRHRLSEDKMLEKYPPTVLLLFTESTNFVFSLFSLDWLDLNPGLNQRYRHVTLMHYRYLLTISLSNSDGVYWLSTSMSLQFPINHSLNNIQITKLKTYVCWINDDKSNNLDYIIIRCVYEKFENFVILYVFLNYI